jgi:hypothetical protein
MLGGSGMVILLYLNTNMFLFPNFFLPLHPFLHLVIIEEVDLSCFYLAQMNAELVDYKQGLTIKASAY